jgi:hypothetical protein
MAPVRWKLLTVCALTVFLHAAGARAQPAEGTMKQGSRCVWSGIEDRIGGADAADSFQRENYGLALILLGKPVNIWLI